MDPARCLEILGNRGSCGGVHGGHGHPPDTECTNENISVDATPAQAAAEAAAQATATTSSGGRGGQVINLATGTNETEAAKEAVQAIYSTIRSSSTANEDGRGGPLPSDGLDNDNSRSEEQRNSVKEDGVQKKLEGMSTGELVKTFRRAQEERVALYKKFNNGLKHALRNGDYSGYPALCCEVTAGFSVLSKAVNAVEAILDSKPDTKPLGGIIRKVQGHEEQLLTLTAAHHLESMREARALGMGPGMGAHAGGAGRVGGGSATSPGYDGLLKEEVGKLARRAEAETSAVMELLEELRYEADGLE